MIKFIRQAIRGKTFPIILFAFAFFKTAQVGATNSRQSDFLDAAGQYYAAIVFAGEFKNTRCGRISIDKKWTDRNRAHQEIRGKISPSLRREFDNEWLVIDAEARRQVQKLIDLIYSSKYQGADCMQIQGVFWEVFDKAVTRWKGY